MKAYIDISPLLLTGVQLRFKLQLLAENFPSLFLPEDARKSWKKD